MHSRIFYYWGLGIYSGLGEDNRIIFISGTFHISLQLEYFFGVWENILSFWGWRRK